MTVQNKGVRAVSDESAAGPVGRDLKHESAAFCVANPGNGMAITLCLAAT